MVSLMGAAGCYCCGYGAYTAYLRRHPPQRRLRGFDPDPGLTDDVARGIAEIEAYLASVAPPGRP
jgi:trans-aconitate methyltransferase